MRSTVTIQFEIEAAGIKCKVGMRLITFPLLASAIITVLAPDVAQSRTIVPRCLFPEFFHFDTPLTAPRRLVPRIKIEPRRGSDTPSRLPAPPLP